jgi:hypothetical protein
MPASAKLNVIADHRGRVVAAELARDISSAGEDKAPRGALVALEGQRHITFDVPAEVLALSGPELHRLLSKVKIHFDGRVDLPKIKITRMKHE